MKRIVITVAVGLFLTYGLKAQAFLFPKFEGKNVVVKITESSGVGSISGSDGSIETYTVKFTGTVKEPIDFPKITANAITQITDQGYKYIDSNGSGWVISSNGFSVTYYIFKKD